jgi:mannose-6-phosphate isomerase-like protein (cupin superfamily)
MAQMNDKSQIPVYGAESFYRSWIAQEGIPIYEGFYIEDLSALELRPWRRVGGKGAYVALDGMAGTDGAYVIELAAGEATRPQRHIYEEVAYVLSGSGETEVWQKDKPKQKFAWEEGTLFSVPLNAWHQCINRGKTPARLAVVTTAPVILDLYHNADFVFNNDFTFSDRYDSQEGYFETRRPFRYEGLKDVNPDELVAIETSVVRDIRKLDLKLFPRGVGNSYAFLQMADNAIAPHIAAWEIGVYSKAHRHGPGSIIIIVEGKGHSLVWDGHIHYSKGKPRRRVDWRVASMFVPPLYHFHQHFNTGSTPGRYVAIAWVGRKYRVDGLGTESHVQPVTHVRDGGNQIDYEDEDPLARQMFEEELKKSGVESRMPPVKYRDPYG